MTSQYKIRFWQNFISNGWMTPLKLCALMTTKYELIHIMLSQWQCSDCLYRRTQTTIMFDWFFVTIIIKNADENVWKSALTSTQLFKKNYSAIFIPHTTTNKTIFIAQVILVKMDVKILVGFQIVTHYYISTLNNIRDKNNNSDWKNY